MLLSFYSSYNDILRLLNRCETLTCPHFINFFREIITAKWWAILFLNMTNIKKYKKKKIKKSCKSNYITTIPYWMHLKFKFTKKIGFSLCWISINLTSKIYLSHKSKYIPLLVARYTHKPSITMHSTPNL